MRKRAQRACSQCHTHKTKCSGDLPKCKRCEAANLVCEYTPTRRRFTNVRFHSPKAESQASSALQPVKAEENTAMSPASSSTTSISPYLLDSANLQAEYAMSSSLITAWRNGTKLTVNRRRDMLLRRDIILTHLDAYFDFLYMVPSLGFLHPEVTYRDVQV